MAKKMNVRQKGVPNLVKTETGFRNKYGVEITREEKRKLESLVNSANRKRKRQLAKAAQLPMIDRGKPTEQSALQGMVMGHYRDIIITQKTKSVQRFESRAEFDSYMRMLERVTDRNYEKNRMMQYKENYLKAVVKEFGGAGMDIYEKVQKMSLKQFMSDIYGREELEIRYVYGPENAVARREGIRLALGLESKEWF